MENAIAYVRVSTQEQAIAGVSLDAQEAKVRAYCTLTGLSLLDIVREEGVSAGIPLAERPGGKHLLESADSNGVRHIIALKLDRLFRDAVDALSLTREWDRAGIALHLIDMGGQALNTGSAMGRFFLAMMASFAELEKNLIGERTALALGHKKALRQAYSPTPFGFDRIGDALKANENEQGILGFIRSLRGERWSFGRIAEELNRRGVPTKKGARWHPSTIHYVLQNDLHQSA